MLSNRALYRIWRQRLAQLIPEGLTHQRYRVENLFWLVIGIYQARHIALSLIARKVPLRVQKLSLYGASAGSRRIERSGLVTGISRCWSG